MFRPRYYLVRSLNIPFFVEVVLDSTVITLRTYREVAPQAQATPDANALIEYVSMSGGQPMRLPAPHLLAEQPASASPLGQHSPILNGLRLPFFRPAPDARFYVVAGELLSDHLRGRFFVEAGSATLDRSQDKTLTPDLWMDGAEWVFDLDVTGLPVAPYCKSWFNPDKLPRSSRLSMILGRRSVLRVYQPFHDTPFDQCSLYFLCERHLGFRCSRQLPWVELQTQTHDLHFLPEVKPAALPSIAPDGALQIQLNCVDPETGEVLKVDRGTVLVDCESGYLPRRRIPIAKGVAEFEVRALGLRAGESIRVHAGFEASPRKTVFDVLVK